MWNFQRIICIWICCVSCMFGTTQLSSLVQAVPYEYFDDHEQNFYDLDTEQIQAKYDARLLSQQMLQTEQQQQQHLENLKGLPNSVGGRRAERRQPNDDGSSYISTATPKVKSNDGHTLHVDTEDGDDNERNVDWLEETSTKAAALPLAITETLDEIHLPRAASCFTNGQTFTHGQKVPRLDSCEVCLCMDGEIFCWWEKCDKKPTNALTTYDDYSTPYEESSTARMQINPKTTYKTTLKPMKKPITNEDYKNDNDESAEIHEIQWDYEGLKEQLLRKEHKSEQHKTYHNQQMAKKKTFQQNQKEEKHTKKLKEKIKSKASQEEQEQHKSTGHFEHGHHGHNHNNNRNNNHNYGLSGSSSKILNFPENIPSVLYYDYKTEEHHQHQHQHREQHLKHQRQKQQHQQLLQQHEKKLNHQQQHHISRHHEYGHDFNTHNSRIDKPLSTEPGTQAEEEGGVGLSGSRAQDATKLHSISDGSSTTFKYFSNGNENIYGANLQTDSDILPEPPTKMPKFLTSVADTKTTEIPTSQLYRLSTTTTAGTITKSTTGTWALTNTPPAASIPLKKQIFSIWDYNEKSRDKASDTGNHGSSKTNSNGSSNNNNESSEGIIETLDQDDAFHRWLTSTETNNKNNFTLNNEIIGRNDDGGPYVAAGGSALDATNNDYNVENKNYENIDLENGKEFSMINTKIQATVKPLTITEAATKAINAFDMALEGGGGTIYYENIQKPKYVQYFSGNDTSSYNSNLKSNNLNNNNEIINGNDKINNNRNNMSPFNSNPYQNYNKNNNNMFSSTSSSTLSSSNEDNGVGSVVNIDIMLTASSADLQQQQLQQTNIETTNQLRQLQLHDFEHEKPFAKTLTKVMQPPVSNSITNDVDNSNPLYSIINNNNTNFSTNSNNENHKNITNIVGDGPNIEEEGTQLQKVSANLSSTHNNGSNSKASNHSLSSSSNSFNFNHISAALKAYTNETSAAVVVAVTTAAASPTSSTTLNPERQCNVMGTLYKIGDVLPQDTGNCLQCICIDGSTSDDTPRVTCSPHNCPPLVLPDLFDATGY